MDGVAPSYNGAGSDYGSDFGSDDELILNSLLEQTPDKSTTGPNLVLGDIEDNEGPRGARLPRVLGRERREAAKALHLGESGPNNRISIEVEDYRSVSAPIESPGRRADRVARHASAEPEPSINLPSPALKPEVADLRSPLERFRTKPMKALSVTDLISPSWCELQYWYVLTKHGKKRRTPAMKQGSAVHKTLEDQVHRTVEVETKKSEDAWGLRIWNIIQGLRTLRDTGMTRELELWGIIDGQIVNGVIDELSYRCPDRELEEASEKPKNDEPQPDQRSIESFFHREGVQTLEGLSTVQKTNSKAAPKVYLMDVKTRGVKSVPKGASFRPTLMQLFIYRRLLADIATNRVDASILFARYGLNPSETFSDSFIAQIGNLNEVYFDAPVASSNEDLGEAPSSTQDSMQALLEHNSLAQLWQLMIEEFQQTMPAGADSIGKVLRVEYRNQSDGEIQGEKTFLYDDKLLQRYIEDEMRWWKGERDAVGVPVEEAYKCGYCEFSEDCSWRKNKIEEATEAHRRKSMGPRSKSTV